MKVLLPSNGLFGQKSVKVRIPTFADIRAAQDQTDEFDAKYSFVQSVSNIDPNKITVEDADYLFTILVFSVLLNSVSYDIECSCGNKYKHFINLTDCDVIDLKERKFPFKKRILFSKYKYNLLTLQQLIDAHDYAQYKDDVELAFSDAQVAFSMGIPLKDTKKVSKIPTGAYISSFVFRKHYYHGIDPIVTAICPHCKKETKFKFTVSMENLKFSVDDLMSKFVPLSSRISFADFLSMSILDFNAFVSQLNKQVNG